MIFSRLSCRLALFLLIVPSFVVKSQVLNEFVIEEKQADETAVVQASTQYPTDAMVLVYTALRDLNFRSSIGGLNQQRYNERANRYELLISPQRQILFVSAPDFIEQRLALINAQPKEVFYYLVTARRDFNVPVVFIVEPKDALLLLDDIPYDINQGIRVPKGESKLRIEREGYKTIEKTIFISEDVLKYSYTLEELELVPVLFGSSESNASIFIDGKEVGVTDESKSFGLFLFPGKYEISVQKSGFVTQTRTVEIFEDRRNTFLFELTKNSGRIRFDVTPDNAKIAINRMPFTGGKLIDYLPGKYRVDISLDGYESFSQIIEVKLGEEALLRADLQPMVGNLKFSVKPALAEVVLLTNEGTPIKKWTGLHVERGLPIGSYKLAVSLDGYASELLSLVVERDSTLIVDVELHESANSRQQYSKNDILKRAVENYLASMVRVEGGEFVMGCAIQQSGKCNPNEIPARRVRVDDFFMSRHEVSVEWFALFIESTGYRTDAERLGGSRIWTLGVEHNQSNINWRFDNQGQMRTKNQLNHPVIHVSWNDAKAFCEWLSVVSGKHIRLPYEAEWEFASGGGLQSRGHVYSGSNSPDLVGWYSSNSGGNTHRVGEKSANQLGLFDMTGNVSEWVMDWYADDNRGEVGGPPTGSKRAFRGGSWNSSNESLPIFRRFSAQPEYRDSEIGFRIVYTP